MARLEIIGIIPERVFLVEFARLSSSRTAAPTAMHPLE